MIEIKRIDDDFSTYWQIWKDGKRVADFPTFRRAWNAAKAIGGTKETIKLDPLDR